jgi:hypothetical protein
MTKNLVKAFKRGRETAPEVAAYALYMVVAGTIWAGDALAEKDWKPWKHD